MSKVRTDFNVTTIRQSNASNKYGLFWQIIAAKYFAEWVGDPAGLERVMHEVIQMTELDFAKLQKAFAGK